MRHVTKAEQEKLPPKDSKGHKIVLPKRSAIKMPDVGRSAEALVAALRQEVTVASVVVWLWVVSMCLDCAIVVIAFVTFGITCSSGV